MKVLTFSRHFPARHPKAGQPTWFVEKIWKSVWDGTEGASNPLYPFFLSYDKTFPCQFDIHENIHNHTPKLHTIRTGTRWKVGDMASLRVWSDKPYCSKQVEFAQVEVKRVIPIEIYAGGGSLVISMDGVYSNNHELIAKNDGLSLTDFVDWFNIHPKKTGQGFNGQIICWHDVPY